MPRALDVANEIIRDAAERGITVTNLSLQKLAYFAHGWHLALTGEPLIEEGFEAWRFGPVVPSLYHKFKLYSSNPIPPDHPLADTPPLDEAARAVIVKVIEVFGGRSGFELVGLSHDPAGPWHRVFHDPAIGATIPDRDIGRYFKQLAGAGA
ncbi:MAG: hypothetical protein RLZZ501_1677 [Pseudomonadota bacterium]|jgi:uncharacterized phage-associated protein